MAALEAVSTASLSGVDLVAAAAARAQSVADLLARRSPGERTAAQLTKTKHKYSAVLAERETPAPVLPPPAAAALLPAAAPPLYPIPELLPVLAEGPLGGPAVFVPFPGGGLFGPVGGGGGGGVGPPTQPPPTQPPPVQPPPIQPPAVPEPGTWATMILGLGIIGFTLRRRRAAEGSSFVR